MDVYFGVNCRNPIEIKIIKEVQPKCIMLSFYYWHKKDLHKLIDKIGYKPKIMLDSGGYSGKLDPIYYIDYIKEYFDVIDYYIAPDYLPPGINIDNEITVERNSQLFMLFEDYELPPPIPVFHYGEDKSIIKTYLKDFNCPYIAIGNTVGKIHYTKLKDWINDLINDYLIDFHLLGSTGKTIINGCPLLKSCDSTTWIQNAKKYGKPKHLNNIKERAIFQMKMIESEYDKEYTSIIETEKRKRKLQKEYKKNKNKISLF